MNRTVLLGGEIELAYGKGLPQRSRVPGKVPVYGSNGQVDTHNEAHVKGPGVIVGRKGSVGEVVWSDADFWPIDTTYYVKLKNKGDDIRYWYYQLKVLGLDKLNSHSAIPGLNRDVAYAKQIIKRTPEEQREIADILGSIDEKIELNRRMNEALEQIGQALFRHYFVNNPAVKNWPLGKFSDFAEIGTGKGSTKSKLKEGGPYPLYGANGVMGTSDEFLVDEPLVITGRVGSLGNVRAVKGKVWLSDNVLYFRPKPNAFGFVYLIAKSFDYNGLNRGSTQPLITQTDLKNITVGRPDSQTLKSFDLQFLKLLELIHHNDEETQFLTTLRDTLLPRLISGKVKAA